MPRLPLLALLGILALSALEPPAATPREDYAATFSIVAYDPVRKEWGIAVASKYLAVGSAVPFARAGAGAVATQAFVNVSLGPKGVELLAAGKSAAEALDELKKSDTGIEGRQLGLVDSKG